MAEQLALTTAGSIAGYSIKKVLFDWEKATIKVVVADVNDFRRFCTYDGTVATTFMVQLNKINLTTTSLQRRILERLVTDGKLPPGTVTGTPD